MKKIYFVLCSLMLGGIAEAQTITTGDMESWRTSTAGSIAPVSVEAPLGWYGADSLIITEGQFFGTLLGIPPSVWHRQLFKERTVVHGGTTSAKLITVKQDTLGYFPGVLTNSRANVLITLSGGTPTFGGITYSGGQEMTERPKTVSAWVKYYPGKDSITHTTGSDTALLVVQCLSHIHGRDSIIGIGAVPIPPASAWTQITANVVYPLDSVDYVDTLHITFTTTGGGMNRPCDSSILYVDDLTMTSVPQVNAVPVVNAAAVRVFPNPAHEYLGITSDAAHPLTITLYAVSGQAVATKALTGNDMLDMRSLATGMYLYAITDEHGNTIQQGKVVKE